MNRVSRARVPKSDFLRDGNEAFIAGRFNLAANCFEKAHRAEPRDPIPLFNLASAKERLGDIDEAAAFLTRALRLKVSWSEPAKRLRC
jgi:Flp pilus assembly protein TadD